MFKVHIEISRKEADQIFLFQNISCLRFIRIKIAKEKKNELFQNISCLRFIKNQLFRRKIN